MLVNFPLSRHYAKHVSLGGAFNSVRETAATPAQCVQEEPQNHCRGVQGKSLT